MHEMEIERIVFVTGAHMRVNEEFAEATEDAGGVVVKVSNYTQYKYPWHRIDHIQYRPVLRGSRR